MAKDSKVRLGIPMERTVVRERPGRWMPVVWLLFAVALTVGIIAAVQTFVPIDPVDQANAEVEEVESSPAGAPPVPPILMAAEPVATPSPAPTPEPEAAAAEPLDPPALTLAVATPAPPALPSTVVAEPPKALLPPGSSATLKARVEAEWREGKRSSGQTYLPPGTTVVIDEALPDGRYRVHWREAEASVAPDLLVPVSP